MAIQLSVAVRNGRLNAIETVISTTPVMRFFTGSPPANCAASNSGTELATLDLPSDWMGNAASGSKALAGTWEDVGIDDGDAGHFRIYAADGTTCHIQGTVTATGGGGDLTLDNVSIGTGQTVTITSFTLTDGNA